MKAKLLLFIALFSVILSQGQEINFKQGATTYLTGSTYNYADTQLNATTSITFTVENLGLSNLLISGSTPRVVLSGVDDDQFVISGSLNATITPSNNDTFVIQFKPTSLGAKSAVLTIESNDADEAIYTVNLTANAVVNKQSTISLPSGPSYTYMATIPYMGYQAADMLSSSDGFEIITFRINDAANAENLPTLLTDVTLSISNSANIRRVALYDGATELAEEDGASSIVFNGLSIEAPAGGTKTFQVLVTFNSLVTDNQNISVGITAATADPAGSNFAAANAGGAVSSTSTSWNKIVVVATALNFVEQPSNADTFAPMDPAVTVEAVDALGSRDLNYTTAVVLTSTGSFHTAGTAPLNDANNNAAAGLVSFPLLIHDTYGTNKIFLATSGSLDPAFSAPFDIETASGASNYFRSAATGKWNELSSWESSGDNITWTAATLIPNALSRSIIIKSGHTITCDSTEEGDVMTISAGGTLKIVAGGVFTVKNGSSWDLTVTGTLEYAGGSFIQAAGTQLRVTGNNTGNYIHSIPSSTLTLPLFTWSSGTTCTISGLTNSVAINPTTMAQNFSKLIWNNPGQTAVVNIDNNAFKVSSTLTLGTSTANKLCISSSGSRTNSIAAVVINGGTLTGFSGTASGTLTMTTLTVTNGKFIGNSSNGITAINNTSTITINANGEYIASNNAGTTTSIVNNVALNSNGKMTLINSASSGNVTINFAGTNRFINLKDTSNLQLESVSSTGIAIMNISSGFTCSSTATPAVDFGTGNVTGNRITLKGSFAKSGTGDLRTSSTTNAATGFVFTGANQTFTTAGTSSGVNYTANNTGTFTCNSNFVFGTAFTQKTIFTINAPTLNLGSRIFTGNTTKAQFNIAAGVNIITTHGNGLGGNGATGNFISFASIGNTAADGRVTFGANLNYTFNGTSSTPFPAGGTWTTPNNIVIGGNTTLNNTAAFTLNGTLVINASRTLKLNTVVGADLNLKNTMTINGTFDTNGQNVIVDGGGTANLIVNGTFVTKDTDGFNGVNASVPNIPITMGANGTVDYAGASQPITNTPYRNLKVSGTGTKTLGNSVITASGNLNVTASLLRIEADKTLSIADKITTTATTTTKGIIVENDGSLVQINTVDNATTNENTGDIRVIRNTMPVFKYDYTYWSSPIHEDSGFTLANLSPLTMFNKFFKWNHVATTQAWQVVSSGAETMAAGRGYIVRPPTTYDLEGAPGAVAQEYVATFIGIPNNGEISHAITGSTTVDKFNLLGNPYPSALDATAFLDENDTVLDGSVYLWTHNSAFGASSGYGYGSDYATFSAGSGGVATKGADGNANDNTAVPTGKIASGQSFFVKGIADGAGTAVFNNTMRTIGNNNQFFRQSQTEPIEKNRIWLNLKGETQGFNQTLVGYITDATNGLDSRYDAQTFGGNQLTFYSVLDTKKLVIQGRALPFTTEDTVPLGYKSTIEGNLTISIDHFDGLFSNQDIYLKDNVLNVEHDLKAAPYTFASAIGTFDTRFVLQYVTQGNLSNPTFEQALKGVTIYKKDNDIHIKSQYETIDQVYVYDITGRLIFERKNANTNAFDITEMNTGEQVLIVKIILENGGINTQKVF
ncbi:T9SS sorting signal type C domain-containing protein [Flavobacterium sp. SM2513]|uniref:T9SS sorting signal type C domain-containing protein n=1 Tax=Flavobacterium sp. SM2513 TaxID=3424766 RepID=UPI003D7FE763